MHFIINRVNAQFSFITPYTLRINAIAPPATLLIMRGLPPARGFKISRLDAPFSEIYTVEQVSEREEGGGGGGGGGAV